MRSDRRYVDLGDGRYVEYGRWAAEQEANRQPTDEMLEEAIAEALAHGVDRERVRAVVDGVFRQGGEGELSELLAAMRVRQLWGPSPYHDPPSRRRSER